MKLCVKELVTNNLVMKKIMISLAAIFAAVVSVNAQQTVTQNKDLDKFTEIKVTDKFSVRLKNSSSYSVSIKSDERIAEYIRPIVKNGVLSFILDEKSYPAELKKALKAKGAAEPVLEIDVCMPLLKKLTVEDKAIVLDSDVIAADNFKLSVEDHAVVNKLFLECGTAELEFSNNSMSNVSVDVNSKIEVETANSATVNIRHKGGNGIFATKGSSVLNLDSESLELLFETSGSSECFVSGTTSTLCVEASGSSHIDAEVLDAKDGVFKQTGSCECNVNVVDHIKVDLTGGSTLTFKRKPEIEVDRIIKSTLIKADDPDRKK